MNPISHRCSNGHISERFGTRVAQEAAKGNMMLVFFGCGCSVDRLGRAESYVNNLKTILWKCPVGHGASVVSVKPYVPNFPSDLSDEFWNLELESAAKTFLEVLNG